MIDETRFHRWVDSQKDRILRTLIELVNIDTSSPNESRAYPYLMEYLEELGLSPRVEPFPAGIEDHPSYSPSEQVAPGVERSNIRCSLELPGVRRRTVFNVHLDVVPAGESFPRAFDAEIRNGFVYGRGAADTKNNLVMLCEAIRFLKDSNIPLSRNVGVDIVSEEEIGGNGTLACILNGVEADEVVVLEGTGLQVFCGHRGCLTFRVKVTGRAVHMGAYATGVSAIECAIRIIQRLKELEARFMEEVKDDPYFHVWQGLTPVLIGRMEGGEWPGTVPASCTITGNIGFLPRYTIEQVKEMLTDAIRSIDDPWIPEHFEISYPGLKNEAFLTDRDADVVRSLLAAARACGSDQEKAYGWKVSCDGRLYSRLMGGIPTVIFGCGRLEDKHSDHERIAIDELFQGMRILAGFLSN